MCVCVVRTYNSYAVADRVQEALVDGEIGARPAFLLPQSAELRLSAFNYTGNDHFYQELFMTARDQSDKWRTSSNEQIFTSYNILVICSRKRSLEIYMIHSTRAF
jgi:hypothetical protein